MIWKIRLNTYDLDLYIGDIVGIFQFQSDNVRKDDASVPNLDVYIIDVWPTKEENLPIDHDGVVDRNYAASKRLIVVSSSNSSPVIDLGDHLFRISGFIL